MGKNNFQVDEKNFQVAKKNFQVGKKNFQVAKKNFKVAKKISRWTNVSAVRKNFNLSLVRKLLLHVWCV